LLINAVAVRPVNPTSIWPSALSRSSMRKMWAWWEASKPRLSRVHLTSMPTGHKKWSVSH
jgi:hypothetical protein